MMLEHMLRNGRTLFAGGHVDEHGVVELDWSTVDPSVDPLTGRPMPISLKMHDSQDFSEPGWMVPLNEILASREARPEWDFPRVPLSAREGMES